MPDIVERLLDAADELDDMSRGDIQEILRQAALDIQTLRDLLGIRDDSRLKDTQLVGNA